MSKIGPIINVMKAATRIAEAVAAAEAAPKRLSYLDKGSSVTDIGVGEGTPTPRKEGL